MPLLEIRNLTVSFATRHGAFMAVDGIDVSVDRDEVLAIVGEFGLGQVGRDAGGDGPPAVHRDGRRRPHGVRRRGSADDVAPSSAAASPARTWR